MINFQNKGFFMSALSIAASSNSSWNQIENQPINDCWEKYPNLTSQFIARVSSVRNEVSSERLTQRDVHHVNSTKKLMMLSEVSEMVNSWIKFTPSGQLEEYLDACPIISGLKKSVSEDLSNGIAEDTEVEIDCDMEKRIAKERLMEYYISKALLRYCPRLPKNIKDDYSQRLQIELDNLLNDYIEDYFKRCNKVFSGKSLSMCTKQIAKKRNRQIALEMAPELQKKYIDIVVRVLSQTLFSNDIADGLYGIYENLYSEKIEEQITRNIKILRRLNKNELLAAKKKFEKEKVTLSLRLKWSECVGGLLEEMSAERAFELEDKARKKSAELWLEEDRKGKRKRVKKRKAVKRVTTQKDNTVACSSSLPVPNANKSKVKKPSQEEIKGAFVQSLYAKARKYKDAERVSKRWETKDCSALRKLWDTNCSGEPIQRYLKLTDHQIAKQRARHYLPGIDRILSHDTFRTIYSFPKEGNGYGLMADLDYGNGEVECGYVFLGVDGNRIYHRYFERIHNEEERGWFASQEQDTCEFSDNEGDWIPTVDYTFKLESNGVLTLSFNDERHKLHIHPLRKELLEQTLS